MRGAYRIDYLRDSPDSQFVIMASPRVSILMLTYNRPQCIGRAITSVYDQTFHDWELIIVQDGSNPATGELLRDWVERENRIRYFPRGVVGCIAEASNAGLEIARGEYIAILDDDDSWSLPEKLALQVGFLDAHPECVGCGGGYVLVDSNGRRRDLYLKPEQDHEIRKHALLANPIANSTAVFRRMIAGQPVAYDTSMKGYADWDFWLTLGRHGKLYNFQKCLANYALWEGGGSFRQQRVNSHAALRIVWKHQRHYRGFALAFAIACVQYCYSCLPAPVRRLSYSTLSALKKALSSSRRMRSN